MAKKCLSLLLCLCFLLCAVPVRAEEEETQPTEAAEVETIVITDRASFLAFAENCRLDSYSDNLTVLLGADIDLSCTDFTAIPTFGGIFEGRGHTVTLNLTADGSVLGLFRFLRPGAVVRDLNLSGSIAPGGSRAMVGALAGSNGGTVENCTFTGTVTAADAVGGLVGSNAVTGIIDRCSVSGTVIGNHFVGGIAGENLGVIRSCSSDADINTTAAQNEVDLGDITLDNITGSESASTVTDVGGIAGISSGVIRECANLGDVGYRHMGYNIGGIAGTQSGYLTDCTNYGSINGRKEVGGIAGQLEPAASIEYSTDTLQILQEQLNSVSGLAGQASANAQNAASSVTGEIAALQDQIQTAQDALDVLIPDEVDPELPDADTAQAAQTALTNSLTAMPATLQRMGSAAESVASTISRDMQALSNQISAMGATMNGAAEHLGGSLTDISDADGEADLTCKVSANTNYGTVLADRNAGGIVGAISFENDLDPESDIAILGENSLNFEADVRAVIRSCENMGTVTVKKQNAGGIVGWQPMGLVKDSVNTGAVHADAADYVGGIAGNSAGFIRGCSAKCLLQGSTFVGGVAGIGETVTDCRTMVRLSGKEKVGAILGFAEEAPSRTAEEPKILDNHYLVVDADAGAIDGISYAGCAQNLSQQEFAQLANLSDIFRTVTLRFIYENGTQTTLFLNAGSPLPEDQIPPVPEKAGYVGAWDGLQEIDRGSVDFNANIYAVYTMEAATIAADVLHPDGHPALLVQGSFTDSYELTVGELTQPPALSKGQTLLEGWEYSVTGGTVTALRLHSAQEVEAEEATVLLKDASGTWRETPVRGSGRYLVFEVSEGDTAFALVRQPKDYTLYWFGGIAAALLTAAIVFSIKRKKKKPQKV